MSQPDVRLHRSRHQLDIEQRGRVLVVIRRGSASVTVDKTELRPGQEAEVQVDSRVCMGGAQGLTLVFCRGDSAQQSSGLKTVLNPGT